MTTDAEWGILARGLLPDGREWSAHAMTFGKVRLYVGAPGALEYDDGWCCADLATALDAAQDWCERFDELTEPQGWYRHPRTGRRRPDGDPSQEYLNP